MVEHGRRLKVEFDFYFLFFFVSADVNVCFVFSSN